MALLLPALAWLLSAAPAAAADCTPQTGMSPCIDSDPLRFAPGGSKFVSIASASTTAPRPLSLGVAGSYLSRPIVLSAASPDPEGREIEVIDHAYNLSLLSSYALDERVELTAALPVTLSQTGTGVQALTSQSAPPLQSSAWRDPRIGMGLVLLRPPGASVHRFGIKWRLELSLPWGEKEALAGERSLVVAPSLALELSRGIFFAGSEVGARLRQPADFFGARLGSQLATSLGVGVDLVSDDLLSLAVEAWMLPTLISQERTLPGGERIEDAALVPAEWLASVRSSPLGSGELVLQIGGGGGIPLSSQRRAGSNTEHFTGITTAGWRLVAQVRYAPTLAAQNP